MARVLNLGPCVRSVRPFAAVVNYFVSKRRLESKNLAVVGSLQASCDQCEVSEPEGHFT